MFRLQGSSHRCNGATSLIHVIDMVWLYPSPVSSDSGDGRDIYLFMVITPLRRLEVGEVERQHPVVSFLLISFISFSCVKDLMFHVPKRERDIVNYRTTLGHKSNDRVRD